MCVADIFHLLLLDTLAVALHGRFSRDMFPAMRVGLKRPRATIQLFETGSLVMPGPKTQFEALLCAYKVLYLLKQKLGIYALLHNFRPVNTVGAFSLGFPIDLDGFLEHHRACADGSFSVWQPTTYPGLQYHLANPRVTFILYGTGKVVCTGAASNHMQEEVAKLRAKLEHYRLGTFKMADELRHSRSAAIATSSDQ